MENKIEEKNEIKTEYFVVETSDGFRRNTKLGPFGTKEEAIKYIQTVLNDPRGERYGVI
jgi:hypothetical protein